MNRASAQTTCGAFASPPPAATTIGELLFDDTIPNNLPQWWTTEQLTNGLGVKSADFDGNGYPDIVITGNDKDLDPTLTYPAPAPTISAKVIYLGFNSGTNSIQVIDVEILAANATRGAYGVAVGDVNGDGRPDIAVCRRMNGASLYPAYVLQGQRDTVFLNDGLPNSGTMPGTIRLFDTGTLINPLFHPETVPSIADPSVGAPEMNGPGTDVAQTFGIEIADLNGFTGSPPKRTLDIVTSGAYGIRFFSGNGDGTFTYQANMREMVPGTSIPTSGPYRNIALGDVDGDRDIDMFITRMPGSSGFAPPDRVWFNSLNNPPLVSIPPGYPFSLTPGPDGTGLLAPVELNRPAVLCWSYRTAPGVSPAQSGECLVETAYNNDADLGDVDGDGDLDLVMAASTTYNTLYLNDGTGRFGSANTSPDGCPAHVFSSPTPDWPPGGASTYAPSKVGYGVLVTLGWNPSPTGYLAYEFRVSGKLLEQTSSARMRDINGDGYMDVIFANRNDIQDAAEFARLLEVNSQSPVESGYLSPQIQGPLVYDHVYYGRAPSLGETFGFCAKVEEVGMACDGTSYVEFVDIGGDRKLDWIESNYANNYYYDFDLAMLGPMKELGFYGLTRIWYSTGNWVGPPCGY